MQLVVLQKLLLSVTVDDSSWRYISWFFSVMIVIKKENPSLYSFIQVVVRMISSLMCSTCETWKDAFKLFHLSALLLVVVIIQRKTLIHNLHMHTTGHFKTYLKSFFQHQMRHLEPYLKFCIQASCCIKIFFTNYYFRPQCNLFIFSFSFSLSQHAPTVYGRHQVFLI
jgi:hypothetical protein